jgi:hypothetical protein
MINQRTQSSLHYSNCPLVIIILLKHFLFLGYICVCDFKNISDIIYSNVFFLLSTDYFSFQSDSLHS